MPARMRACTVATRARALVSARAYARVLVPASAPASVSTRAPACVHARTHFLLEPNNARRSHAELVQTAPRRAKRNPAFVHV
eukprot:5753007-Lingulodinium_polyedra.AAC.1